MYHLVTMTSGQPGPALSCNGLVMGGEAGGGELRANGMLLLDLSFSPSV